MAAERTIGRTLVVESTCVGRSTISSTGTVTLLFTDLVRSTELYDRLGDEAAERVRRAHFGRLRDAAAAYEGEVVKTLGDGVMLAFPSSVKALSCAIVMQQLTSHEPGAQPEHPLGLRIGINVGEVVSEEDDYFGGAVVLASRLCDRAEPGQILVSELVRSLLGSRGGYSFRQMGPLALKGIAEPQQAYEVEWRAALPEPTDGQVAGELDSGDMEEVPLTRGEVDELQQVLAMSGLADVSLANRYAVVFAYPGMGLGDLHRELAGCTTQVCAIIEETDRFHQHGIQVVGLSTEPSVPPEGCRFIPFPVGLLPQDAVGGVIEAVDKGSRKYARRESFVVFPDGTGARIGNVTDVIAHVKRSFAVAVERRLDVYRQAAIDYLERGGGELRSTVEFRELLATGADSVAIPRVDVKLELVCKIADPAIIATEAGYVERINRVLTESGCPRLFPAVVSVCSDENPGWYLMEAANPVSLDKLVFRDQARTELHPGRRALLLDAFERVAKLYELTFRAETPKVARYHYLERFLAIPQREDARSTYSLLFGTDGGLDSVLKRRLRLGDGLLCRSYAEQMRFLELNVDALLQPVGAYVHGDLHLPNMLLDRDGKSVVFIDPRVVWDGNDVGDPGFCDPIYDLATLLHSLHVGSAILRAIEEGCTEDLLVVAAGDTGGAPIAVAPGLLRIADNPIVEWFVEWVRGEVPELVRGPNWEARLHVGAANALLGWLKYAGVVKTRDAWLAIFVSALYHLELGRRSLDERPQRAGGKPVVGTA